ncbi:hypothetical protein [Rheinheimera sp. EpRS3]|uniref:hypothetical protein n=1 Tax=Rheinheimera sp. EpRS3 TaxID=1712383 RepID=UPI000AE6F36E|nr:hypothetical protein [Rheinheimera sp. EpRS3]
MNSEFSSVEAVQKYLPLMYELAIRLDHISKAFDGNLGLSAPFAYEYAYFQFRRVCELIALGCLTLHGDIPALQKSSTKKEWNAERIMNLLHQNYSYAFPECISKYQDSLGWHIQANSKPNALSRSEFKDLYSECGHVLHRGTIKTVEISRDLNTEMYKKAMTWHSKLVDLMSEHAVTRSSQKGMYVISLKTNSGYPECSIFTEVRPGELSVHTQKMSVSDQLKHSYIAKTE